MENQPAISHPDAGDYLTGAAAIAVFLRELGFSETTTEDVFYLVKSGKITVGRFGRQYLGSKKRIARELRATAAAPTTNIRTRK
jgi:hypothetical protein